MDDKGNSCKRKWDIASQVDNIGILLWFLLSTFFVSALLLVFALHSQLLALFILAKIVLLIIFESFRSRHS
jgi:membrane protein implicated in regulation of membrane protease activity